LGGSCAMAKDLNIDYKEMFLNTLRENLYSLKTAMEKAVTIEEKERKHRERVTKKSLSSRMSFILKKSN
jgi:hypothetical protein